MSTWTHVICQSCWNKRHDVREPMQMRDAPEEQCCYCQRMNNDGLYVRENPTNTPCQGKTGVHAD